MTDLRLYRQFFAQRTFDKDTTVEFFKDGSFAICKKDSIEFRSAFCKRITTILGSDLRVLSNGIVISVEHDKVAIVANGDNIYKKRVEIPISENTKVISSGPLIAICEPNSKMTQAIYMLDNCGFQKFNIVFDNMISQMESSYDGEVFAISFVDIAKSPRIYKWKGHLLYSGDSLKIDVIGNGSYIVHTVENSTLYTRYREPICVSEDIWGIKPLSSNYAVFEDKFIINAGIGNMGAIVADYNDDIVDVGCGGTVFTKYITSNKYGTGRMLNGRKLHHMAGARFHNDLIVVYSQNTFFPFLFSENRADFGDNILYYKRLRDMLMNNTPRSI